MRTRIPAGIPGALGRDCLPEFSIQKNPALLSSPRTLAVARCCPRLHSIRCGGDFSRPTSACGVARAGVSRPHLCGCLPPAKAAHGFFIRQIQLGLWAGQEIGSSHLVSGVPGTQKITKEKTNKKIGGVGSPRSKEKLFDVGIGAPPDFPVAIGKKQLLDGSHGPGWIFSTILFRGSLKIYLVDPASSICSSRGLSHACLRAISRNCKIAVPWICE